MDTKAMILSLKVLTIVTFLAVVLISMTSVLVMIRFADVISVLYSFYFILPLLVMLLIIFIVATLSLTVVSLHSNTELNIMTQSVNDYLREEGYL